ncbi:hypothetical protein ASPACDRAFT_38152 [Aspergillus aculeatus ATCC 16872]|uniref:F-box domain-containing protein n=1 Tax=Aspergillus aculeatus (strain ATCC 16872 / CBS 172.66 / WB 5094) TaxID=690307 RepID=A0A1L9X826_ASPA1|nr:uncharacterized protein ASPACDRAFT_38152 [Aspergillus aculeatus ATCC 16872]OJK04591.1 hypothetical protein ASPACDRAFT_38152 [Aspergillus aculeatus ATCC 16872]
MTMSKLPPELHLEIATHLPATPDLSRSHFAQTNHYFHALLPHPSHTELLAAELDPLAIANDLYACRYCLRLRRVTHFADRMVRRGRGRFGAERERAKRFCLDCGVLPRQGEEEEEEEGVGVRENGGGQAEGQAQAQAQATRGEARYGYGDLVRVQGVWMVFCGRCRGLRQVVPVAMSGSPADKRRKSQHLQVSWEEEQSIGMRMGRDLGCEGCLPHVSHDESGG